MSRSKPFRGGSPRFLTAGGLRQLSLNEGSDLQNIAQLDLTLWAAVSCPVRGQEFDERTLQLIDTDGDGRIRPPEVRQAVTWVLEMLRSPQDLHRGLDGIALSAMDDTHEPGRRWLTTARRILENRGEGERSEIQLSDVTDTKRLYSARTNGDGVVSPSATEDAGVKQLISEIRATVGGSTGLDEEDGVRREDAERFFQEVAGFLDWSSRGLSDEPDRVFPLGEKTAQAHEALQQVRQKIEDYYARCRIAAYEEPALEAMNRGPRSWESLHGQSRSEVDAELETWPLAHVTPEGRLPLSGDVNPVYAARLDSFRERVVRPLLDEDQDSMDEQEFARIIDVLQPFADWSGSRVGSAVAGLGEPRLKEIVESGIRTKLDELFAEDDHVAGELTALGDVERLLRFHRDLFRFCRNFVSLADFYQPEIRALFQAGELVLDGRSFTLCVPVEDPARHTTMAALSGVFLIYCRLSRGSEAGRTVAAAVTAGNADRLKVGKNGVFIDRAGRDWDATIVQVVSHEINLRQAVWAPFKRLGVLVSSQIERLGTTQEKSIQGNLEKGFTEVNQDVAALPRQGDSAPAGAAPEDPKRGSGVGGVLAGGGVAIAALSSSFAFISSKVAEIDRIYFVYTGVVFLLFIIVPTIILAILKLRRRDLGMILEACGWAINGHIRLSMGIAGRLTRLARLPEGAIAVPMIDDPAINRRTRRRRVLLCAILAAVAAAWILPRIL